MMKLKPYLGNLANPVLYLSPLFVSILFIFGCATQIEPTYKEKDIPYHVKKICKDEYNLEVITKSSHNALWIYAALPRIMHKDFGKDKDKLFDEEMFDKLRNILTTIGRVIISADKSPEFYCLVVSDVSQIGIDYTLIGNVLDIKKSYAGFIPWTETNRRYVIKLELNPQAIGDTSGEHLRPYDINLRDFLAAQIIQRISARFQDEELKEYFKVNNVQGKFMDDSFIFEYAITEISKPAKKIDIKKEVLEIISYCLQTYEFQDFLMVEIKDTLTQGKWVLSKAALRGVK